MLLPTPNAAPHPDDSPQHTLYVLVRTDIDPAHQVVQAAHAAAEAGRQFYEPAHGIARLIVLAVRDAAQLQAARAFLQWRGVESTVFFEPDFGMGHSALATRPLVAAERKLMRRWPLWQLPAVG